MSAKSLRAPTRTAPKRGGDRTGGDSKHVKERLSGTSRVPAAVDAHREETHDREDREARRLAVHRRRAAARVVSPAHRTTGLVLVHDPTGAHSVALQPRSDLAPADRHLLDRHCVGGQRPLLGACRRRERARAPAGRCDRASRRARALRRGRRPEGHDVRARETCTIDRARVRSTSVHSAPDKSQPLGGGRGGDNEIGSDPTRLGRCLSRRRARGSRLRPQARPAPDR